MKHNTLFPRWFLFAALLASALPLAARGDGRIAQVGPWRLGMTRAEAEGQTDYGPYVFEEANGWLNTSKAVFNSRQATASLQFKDGVVVTIQVTSYQDADRGQAIAAFIATVNYFRRTAGMPSLDDPAQIDLTAEIQDKAKAIQSGNVIGNYRLPEILGTSVILIQGQPTGYRVLVVVREEGTPETPGPMLAFPIESQDSITPAIAGPVAPASAVQPGASPGSPIVSGAVAVPPGTVSVPGSAASKFKANISTVNALLVRPLGSGGNAAEAMKLTATAAPVTGDNLLVRFNQTVGKDMSRALGEVVRGIQVKYQALPASMEVRLGFADKWGGKDGPSASVACGLLLESLVNGFKIPAYLAVTGDMNADLTVQPVGGVPDKLRGAMAAGCTVIGIPAANEEDLSDLVVEEGIGRFLRAQVLTLKTLDDALVLANEESRGEEVRAAMADFLQLQKELQSGGAALLAKPETQDRIVKIGQAMPNHFSAKMLLYAAQRRLPTHYSLVGTLIRMDEAMAPFSTAVKEIKGGANPGKYLFSRDNPMSQAQGKLVALRSKSDERLTKLINAQASLVTAFQRTVGAGDRASFQARLRELIGAQERNNAEADHFKSNKAIQDELMRRGGGGDDDDGNK